MTDTDKRVLDFLEKERVCVLATLLSDGSPHTAALHFSAQADPICLYFSVDSTSRKYQGLLEADTIKGSITVGFSEVDWITLQMDGLVEKVDSGDLARVQKIHYAKNPGSEKHKDIPTTVFIKFIPTWYRYSDFNHDLFLTSNT